MVYIIIFGLVALVIVLVLSAVIIIPPYHFGVVSRLGYRLRGQRGILQEGPNLIIPFIDSVELVSKELITKEIGFSFTTKDRIQLKVKGIFQYRPNPSVWHEDSHLDAGRNVFVTVGEEAIQSRIREAVESGLGTLGGRHDHSAFIEERAMIGEAVMIALLAMGIEKRYGISIESVFLSGIDFSLDVRVSFEAYRNAMSRIQAAEPRLELAKRFKNELGVSPQTAADQADLAMDPAVKKSVISIQGETGVLGGLISAAIKKNES